MHGIFPRYFLTLFITFAFTSSALSGTCSSLGSYEGGKVNVWKSADGLITFTANVDVNTDGTLTSYKADDLGHWNSAKKRLETKSALNTICNGAQIRDASDNILYGPRNCGKLIREFERIRKFGWIKQNENYVDLYAIARSKTKTTGKNRGVPCEVDGYYVSMTAKPIDASKDVCDPERWIDSLRIPAIVLPLDKKMKAAKVTLRDLAIVRLPGSRSWVGAIVGDTNRTKIGEGTINLARRLKNKSENPKNYRDVLSFVINEAEYVVFPGSAAKLGKFGNSDDAKIQAEASKLFVKYQLDQRMPVCAP